MSNSQCSRRSFLAGTAGSVVTAALAGCVEPPSPVGGGDDGYAAFFTLEDWCAQVAGDRLVFENPVPVGRMGHGFEPDGDLTREVANGAVFVYLDTPEFRWAQDVASTLEADYDDVLVIDGLSGFSEDQLLAFDATADVEPDRDHDWDPTDVTVAEFDLIDDRVGGVPAYWHEDHWHGGLPDVAMGDTRTIRAKATDSGGHVLPFGGDEPFQLTARLADNVPDDVVELQSDGRRVTIEPISTGRTQLVFAIEHDGVEFFDTAEHALDVRVVEDADDVEVDEFYDPHVWTDPVLARDVIDNIVAGLSAVDPDNAAVFEDNAAAYAERLAAVDEQLEAVIADADRTTAVFAGHDSFQYLEHRYGFELHTPVGVSPDQSPSPEDIARTIDLVDDEGIDTILYDPFEVPDEEVPPLAATIVENSAATNLAPLTPAEGTTQEWLDRGWGWIEQMEEINVPALEAALGRT